MSPPNLAVFVAEGLPLKPAIAAYRSLMSKAAVAMLMDPTSFVLARLDAQGRLSVADGHRIDLTWVFEARLFDDFIELRWLRDSSGDGGHRAVILAETEVDLSEKLDGWKPLKIVTPIIDALEQTYLLWGEGTSTQLADGWSELATPRIGTMPVPLPGVKPHERVLMRTREYLAEFECGNVGVFDERLVRLEVASA
jgi:CRISPR-associated protein (TIGR03984 family)